MSPVRIKAHRRLRIRHLPDPVGLLLVLLLVAGCGGSSGGTVDTGAAADVPPDANTPADVPADVPEDSGSRDTSTPPDAEPDISTDAPDIATDVPDIAPDTPDISTDAPEVVPPPVLLGLRVEPESAEVSLGNTVSLKAYATYDDESEVDMTDVADWVSSDPFIAQVSILAGERGKVTGVGIGQTRIEVALGDQSAHATIDVLEPKLTELTVTPDPVEIIESLTQAFTATALMDNGTEQDVTDRVAWESTDTEKLVFLEAAEPGTALAVAEGVVNVRAQWLDHEISGQAVATVVQDSLFDLKVSPLSIELFTGTSGTFSVHGTFVSGAQSPLSSGVEWSSSDWGIATVSETGGKVQAIAPGTATITAEAGGLQATGEVTVRDAALVSLEILPAGATIPSRATRSYQAVGHYDSGTSQDLTVSVTWSSSDPGVISISNEAGSRGLATAGYKGDAQIHAEFGTVSGATPVYVRLKNGYICENGNAECASGICAVPGPFAPAGYCCPTPCVGGCRACNSGTCQPVAAGTDPFEACGRYTCDGGGECHASCVRDAGNCSAACKGWCWDPDCQDKLPGGSACVGNCQCESGTCVLFVCW